VLRRLLAVAVGAVLAGTAAPAVAAKVIPGFEVICFYSHTLKDDPIVDPGKPGAAMHLHDFEGNRATSADSTAAELRAARTNCQLAEDTAAYWTPVLYSHGKVVHPDRLHAYYRWGVVADVARIHPMPAGLKIVAGNSSSRTAQPTSVIGWNCGVQGQPMHNHPISCRRAQKIVLHVFFPNCWDGVNLDSPDHHSHMAYSHNGKCPADHPVPVPRLSEDFGYPIRDGSAIRLSSGSYVTAHADFWNTWHQSAMIRLTERCINAGVQCGPQHD
jgi:hypothetical protein